MLMDINSTVLSGRVFDMGIHPMKNNDNSCVAEGRIMVVNGKKEGKEMVDEFGIRAYGKKAVFIGGLRNGTLVTIQGELREDIRVNTNQPDTVRSKTYINIDKIKVMEVPE